MNSACTLNDVFLFIAGEWEQELSEELDSCLLPAHHFSHRYQKRKRQILAGQKEKLPVPVYRRKLVVVTVFLLALFACAMSVPEIRDPIIEFFERKDNESTNFDFDIDLSNLPPDCFTAKYFHLDYIPEGFHMVKSEKKRGLYYACYKNNNDYFTIEMSPCMQYTIFSIDTENAIVTKTRIKGNYTVISQKGKLIIIAAFDNKQLYIYCLTGNISLRTAYKIVKNIKPNN